MRVAIGYAAPLTAVKGPSTAKMLTVNSITHGDTYGLVIDDLKSFNEIEKHIATAFS